MNNRLEIIGPVELPEGVERLSDEEISNNYPGNDQQLLDKSLKEHDPNLLATVLFDADNRPNIDVNWTIFQLIGPTYFNPEIVKNKDEYYQCLRLLIRYAQNVTVPTVVTEDKDAIMNEDLNAYDRHPYGRRIPPVRKERIPMIQKILNNTYFRESDKYCVAPLELLLRRGRTTPDLKVLIDECGAENIAFNGAKHRSLAYRYFPTVTFPKDQALNFVSEQLHRAVIRPSPIATPMQRAAANQNDRAIALYLSKLIVLKYQNKENKSLSQEIDDYFNELGMGGYRKFKRVAHAFPGIYQKAIKDAKAEIGENVDEKLLNEISTEIEKDLVKKLHRTQEHSLMDFDLGITLMFSLIVTIPIAIGLLIYRQVSQPIKRTEISNEDAQLYQERKAHAEDAHESEASEGALRSSHQSVSDRLETPSPVSEKNGLHLRKTMEQKDRKTTVYFPSGSGQKSRFLSRLRDVKRHANHEDREAEDLLKRF